LWGQDVPCEGEVCSEFGEIFNPLSSRFDVDVWNIFIRLFGTCLSIFFLEILICKFEVSYADV